MDEKKKIQMEEAIRKAEEGLRETVEDGDAPEIPAECRVWADLALGNARHAIGVMKKALADELAHPTYWKNFEIFRDARTDCELERGLFIDARNGDLRDTRTIRSLEAIVSVRKGRILNGEVVPATVTGTMKTLVEEAFDELLKALEATARNFRGYFVRGLADAMDSEMVRFVLVRNRIDWLAESLDRHC